MSCGGGPRGVVRGVTPCCEGEIEAAQRSDEGDHDPHGSQALCRQTEGAAKVEESPKQQGFDNDPTARDDQGRDQDSRGEEAVGPQEAHEHPPGPAR